MRDEIAQIVPPGVLEDWIAVKPKVFYKNNKPYGLIGEVNGLVASTTSEPSLPFTIEMLQYLYKINEKKAITLITDDPDYFDHIMSLLQHRGFEFEVKDNILYSRREQWG